MKAGAELGSTAILASFGAELGAGQIEIAAAEAAVLGVMLLVKQIKQHKQATKTYRDEGYTNKEANQMYQADREATKTQNKETRQANQDAKKADKQERKDTGISKKDQKKQNEQQEEENKQKVIDQQRINVENSASQSAIQVEQDNSRAREQRIARLERERGVADPWTSSFMLTPGEMPSSLVSGAANTGRYNDYGRPSREGNDNNYQPQIRPDGPPGGGPDDDPNGGNGGPNMPSGPNNPNGGNPGGNPNPNGNGNNGNDYNPNPNDPFGNMIDRIMRKVGQNSFDDAKKIKDQQAAEDDKKGKKNDKKNPDDTPQIDYNDEMHLMETELAGVIEGLSQQELTLEDSFVELERIEKTITEKVPSQVIVNPSQIYTSDIARF